jgi:hypothetical protein
MSAPKVKPLVWVHGIVDLSKPQPGMRYVACSTSPSPAWTWWLEGEEHTRAVFLSEAECKAAAQADYERRILDALEPDTEADALRAALKIAEAALSDIGDADREEGDDLAWCERRAAKAIPVVRAALSEDAA